MELKVYFRGKDFLSDFQLIHNGIERANIASQFVNDAYGVNPQWN